MIFWQSYEHFQSYVKELCEPNWFYLSCIQMTSYQAKPACIITVIIAPSASWIFWVNHSTVIQNGCSYFHSYCTGLLALESPKAYFFIAVTQLHPANQRHQGFGSQGTHRYSVIHLLWLAEFCNHLISVCMCLALLTEPSFAAQPFSSLLMYKHPFDLNSASLKLVANPLFCLEVKTACAFQEEKLLPLYSVYFMSLDVKFYLMIFHWHREKEKGSSKSLHMSCS